MPANQLKVRFLLLGDSLAQGLKFEFGKTWFDALQHKGVEQPAIVDFFSETAQAFSHNFNKELQNTLELKKFISKIFVNADTFARASLSMAHHFPAVNPEIVKHQMYAPNVFEIFKDQQYDAVTIALGTNDTQDFNTIAVEELLKKLSERQFEEFVVMLKENNASEKLIDILSNGYKHLNSGEPFASLMPKYIVSRDENLFCLKIAQNCKFASENNIGAFLKDWQDKKFYDQTDEDFHKTLMETINRFITMQLVNERGYDIDVSFILPPNLTENCIFPHYHTTKEKLLKIRELIRSYAKGNDFKVFDLDPMCKAAKKAHGDDNLHLTEEAYKIIEERLDFNPLFGKAIMHRISKELAKEVSNKDSVGLALLEAQSIISQIMIPPQQQSSSNSSNLLETAPNYTPAAANALSTTNKQSNQTILDEELYMDQVKETYEYDQRNKQ